MMRRFLIASATLLVSLNASAKMLTCRVEQIVWHRDGQMAPSNSSSPEVADGAFKIDLDKAAVIARFPDCENCAWILRTRGDDRKSWIWTGGKDDAIRYSVTLKPFDHYAFVVFDLALGDINAGHCL
jgi:hypothetical protein